MRAALLRVVQAGVAEVRKQTSSRLVRLQTRTAPGHARSVVQRAPVTTRVDPGLRLAQQRRHHAAAVVALLDTAGVGYWWLPPGEDGVDVLCAHVDDRSALLAAVARGAGPGVYVDPLDATGRRRRRYVAGAHAADLQAPGVLLWEFVGPAPGSTFVADERQGLRVLFWGPDVEGGSDDLVCLVENVTATRLRPAALEAGRVPVPLRRPRASAVGFDIDVVYTWVDGLDEAWLLDKARAAGVADPALFTERAHDEARFADHDELRHSLRSLEQFAPWVRHVWVVTSGQHPEWLARDHPWVTVVPHRDLWPDGDGLPTFNSHAIETCLHRIPGLSEHFLYLNDDMLLGRPLGPETFFHPNGVGKFFWSRALVDHGPAVTGDIASTTAARNARQLIEERYGVTFSRKFFHTAAALTVSGLAELEATFPEVVAATRRAPFRTLHDVAMAGSFYLNWAYVTGRAVPGRLRYTYVDPAAPDAAARLRRLVRDRTFDAFCVNDGSSEQTPDERRASDRLIRGFLADYLPVRGSFEVES